MADRFARDPVARVAASKATHPVSLFASSGRTTAIEDVLIAQLVEARTDRDRFRAALVKIVELWGDRPEQRVSGAVAVAREALENTHD